MSTPTPAPVWCPAFSWLRELSVGAVFSSTQPDAAHGNQRYCNLCETWVAHAELEAHVREHERERADFGKAQARERSRAQKDTLRRVNEERRLQRKVSA